MAKKKSRERPSASSCGGILPKAEIERRTKTSPSHPQHLHVSPPYESSFQAAAVQVRLGNWFSSARRIRVPAVELRPDTSEPFLTHQQYEDIFVPNEKFFLLHPGDLVLGITYEFIGLPADLMASVEGRSSTGRMGLTIATAAQVAPGFHGGVVLELANTGTVPLKLFPRTAIAQLVFYVLTKPVPKRDLYEGKYDRQVRP